MAWTTVIRTTGSLQVFCPARRGALLVLRLTAYCGIVHVWERRVRAGLYSYNCLAVERMVPGLGFSESFKKCQEQPQNRPCRVEVIRRGFDGADRAQFEKILDDPTVPHSLIVRALAVEGIKVSASTVGLHRRGACSCGIQ